MINDGPKAVNPHLQDLRDLPLEKRKEVAVSGGKASGEARRQKATFKDVVSDLLELDTPKKVAKRIKKAFPNVSDKDISNRAALVYSLIAKGLNGDTRAFEIIRDTIGEKPVNVNNSTINGIQILVSDEKTAELINKI